MKDQSAISIKYSTQWLHSLYIQRKDWLELCKPNLVLMVVFTALTGYWVANPPVMERQVIFLIFMGVFLSGCGSHILNQYYERQTDSLMERTKNRPLPLKKISPAEAKWVGFSFGILGCLLLLVINFVPALVAAVCFLSYVYIYTPLKKHSIWNTWVGAIPGALPVFIGFFAGSQTPNFKIWILFSILFLWQIPHFLALAWKYKEDYQKAGLKMLVLIDKKGTLTAWVMLLHGIALFVVTVIPTFYLYESTVYFFVSSFLSFLFLQPMVSFLLSPKKIFAKKIFIVSIFYLPIVCFCYIVADIIYQ